MKEKDASFTGLQDKEQKVLGFLEWLLDHIDVNNMNMQQKAIKAPQTQLDHAVQALSCVKNAKWVYLAKLMAGVPRTLSSREHSYGPNKCKQNWDHHWES